MRLLLCVLLAVFFISCKKDKTNPHGSIPATTGAVTIRLHYKVDVAELEFNKIIYSNLAGNHYSVSTLKSILSGFTFHNRNGTDWKSKSFFYVDATDTNFSKITFSNIPIGNYSGFDFLIGIDSLHNTSDSVPNTAEFQSMLWMMGEGYHFLKLEGQYISPSDTVGFTVHVGENGFTSQNSIIKELSVTTNPSVFNLKLNVNEWFQNPYTYNFNTDGYAIMGNKTAMGKIALNGSDIFYSN